MFHVKHVVADNAREWMAVEGPRSDWDGAAAEIISGAETLGVRLSRSGAELLVEHARMVYEANEGLNLTRIPAAAAMSHHVLDSLSGLPAMSDAPDGPWADIGSGAGYPGIPLAVVGNRHVDLVESVGKKARFLEGVVAALCLDATVRDCRAEEAALEFHGAYSAVSARAVSALPSLVELASPLLRRGGRLVCWKGALVQEEIDRGATVAAQCGMRLVGATAVEVLGAGVARTLVVFEKTGASRMKLPRRPGMAQRHPFA